MDDSPGLINIKVASDNSLELPNEAINRLTKLVCEIVGDPVAKLMGRVTDSFSFYRWRNQVDLLHRIEAIRAANPTAKRVPAPAFLIDALDAASTVEDETLQDIWARLIDGACRPEIITSPALIVAAKGLSPEAAKLFVLIGRTTLLADQQAADELSRRWAKTPPPTDSAHVCILEHSGLVHVDTLQDARGLPSLPQARPGLPSLNLTQFGVLFFAAVHHLDYTEFRKTWGFQFHSFGGSEMVPYRLPGEYSLLRR